MIKKLSVKDFAIIEDIDIYFHEGLTVLTGETGAGKSLIIDSIQLLLGERASLEMIRNGKDKAIITGEFIYKSKKINSILDSLDIDHDNDTLIISRTISSSKSIAKINDKVVSLVELKSITSLLADIHQQFDVVKLLNKDNYLDIIDGFKADLINEYKNKYLEQLEVLKQKEADYGSLMKKIDAIKLKRDEYEYALKELMDSNLSLEEENDINSRISLLENFDKIYALLGENKDLIDKESLSDIYTIKENVLELAKYQNEYQETYEKLNNYYYELEDIFSFLKKQFNHLDYDPKELEQLEERKNYLNSLKKKYDKSIEELITYQNELQQILSSKEDMDELLEEKKQAFIASYEECYIKATDLSKIRRESSNIIEKEIVTHLNDLALKCDFKIDIAATPKDKDYSLNIFTNNGIDSIDFNIETNIGEGLKPLAKIVSGGEMSRIMLAFKMLFIKSSKISTVIFDEIDTGISGEIARKVALKIKELSLNTQVIAITHLPQVASLSNNHIKISKSVIKGRTYTSIKELNLDEKIYEIASLISGDKVSESQLEYARELVLKNDN